MKRAQTEQLLNFEILDLNRILLEALDKSLKHKPLRLELCSTTLLKILLEALDKSLKHKPLRLELCSTNLLKLHK